MFEKRIEKTLIQPTFVTRLPVELVPLARACEDDPTVVDVFECIIGGREIAPVGSRRLSINTPSRTVNGSPTGPGIRSRQRRVAA